MSTKSFQIPILPDGTIVHYPMQPYPRPVRGEGWHKEEDDETYRRRCEAWAKVQYTWQDPTPFTDTLA